MHKRSYQTECGSIAYWVNDLLLQQAAAGGVKLALVMLPGLTADHRLFDKQVEYFENRVPLLVWDAPGHMESRPFRLAFELDDKARWLRAILEAEGVAQPLLVGQSMGGYVSQAFIDLFPGLAAGFIPIDSAPLQRSYYSGWELWLLKRMEPMYRWYPHRWLIKHGAWGCAQSEYGKDLMRKTTATYEHREYAKLAGHGFRILAEAVEKERPYVIDCPAVLVCGEKDKAGSAKGYNRRWAAQTGLPIRWIADAGHNATTDKPAEVNAIIEGLWLELI